MLSRAAIIGALDVGGLVSDHTSWFVGGAIVLLGLLVLGFKDLLRFSFGRAWAISSVSFAESIRRRVLWLTPLAILGVVLVVQFQKPLDEQDAIRQTIKFSLFATGLVVVLATIILAATNLPKEIENRVIYTVVTKPTTRLEIVVGKVMGFARVSAVILLIMGVFTFGYLYLRAWTLQRAIVARLDAPGGVHPLLRGSLQHYADTGLLVARTLDTPDSFGVYGREPVASAGASGTSGHAQSTIWIRGEHEQDVLVPFDLKPEDLEPPAGADPTAMNMGIVLLADIGYEQQQPMEQATSEAAPQVVEEPTAQTPLGPFPAGQVPEATTAPSAAAPTSAPALPKLPPPPPMLAVRIAGAEGQVIVEDRYVNGGKAVALAHRGVQRPVEVHIAPKGLADLAARPGRFYIVLAGVNPDTQYKVNTDSVQLQMPGLGFREISRAKDAKGVPLPAIARGRMGNFGQQLRGKSGGDGPVAVFNFRGVPAAPGADGKVDFEWRTGVERTSADASSTTDDLTHLSLVIRNQATGTTSEPVLLNVESNHTGYFAVPADLLRGGDFDVLVRCLTDGHWPGLRIASLSVVTGRDSFAYNLLKSLLVMWLLAVMVVIVAVFCSTFLSWPIAIVLTVIILLGNWGVQQLGDSMTPGIGHTVADQLGFKEAAKAKVVSQSVETLNRFLNITSAVLPDISRFSATEDIERGLTIPHQRLWEALQVLAGFGLPVMVLAYVFLKNKEVAP